MSREIKFRAWDVAEKRMLTSWDSDAFKEGLRRGVSMMRSHEFRFNRNSGNMELYTLQATPSIKRDGIEFIMNPMMKLCPEYVLMQFTGLYDKNNKPIYESDIVSVEWANSGRENVIVVWAEQDAAWGYSYGEVGESVCAFCSQIDEGQFPDWKTFEVIGNIYQHPQLVPNGI